MTDATAPPESQVTLDPAVLADGVPDVITTASGLRAYAQRLRDGHGPLALDAERASGYRYSQRAYLVQLRRDGAGTALIDPIATGPLETIQVATQGVEWILHAATQDLPCLAELGLTPTRIFDTELAGRLLGRERVGLGALVASELSVNLEKGHGAADWSVRPLTTEQLRYAALDVEYLAELREHLAEALEAAGKSRWAEEEFTALLSFTPKDRGEEPWRRTSGIHRIRKPRMLAVVRELWETRDEVAARSDIAVGRILPDAAIVAAATALPTSIEALGAIKEFTGRGQQRRLKTWWAAVDRALHLPEDALPMPPGTPVGPPPPRAWSERDPVAFARLQAAKSGLAELAQAHQVPVENLMSPDLVRRICWQPPAEPLLATLTEQGARPWQIDLVTPVLSQALAEGNATDPEVTHG